MQRQARTTDGTSTGETAPGTTPGTSPQTSEQASSPEPTRRARVRMGRKRTRFALAPRPAPAVKALWRAAGAEERTKAHQTCMAILEYWLGKKTKSEVAQRLAVPPLRVWQLSQAALSGMMAGLLRQPRSRARKLELPPQPENDPTLLKRRIVELERKLSRTEDLVRVLQDLPWRRAPEAGDGRSHTQGKGSKAGRSPSRGAGRRAPTQGRRQPPSDRRVDGAAAPSGPPA